MSIADGVDVGILWEGFAFVSGVPADMDVVAVPHLRSSAVKYPYLAVHQRTAKHLEVVVITTGGCNDVWDVDAVKHERYC